MGQGVSSVSHLHILWCKDHESQFTVTLLCFFGWACSLRCTDCCGRDEFTKNHTTEFWEAQLLAALCTGQPASFSAAGLIYCPWFVGILMIQWPKFCSHFIELISHSAFHSLVPSNQFPLPQHPWVTCYSFLHLFWASVCSFLFLYSSLDSTQEGNYALFVFLSLHYFA